MRKKYPNVTHFNQKKENWNKPSLGGTNKLKSSLDPQKKSDRLRLQETVQSTKYSKDLITNLEHKHSNLQTKQEDHLHSPMKENQTQRLKNFTKSSLRCDVQTSES